MNLASNPHTKPMHTVRREILVKLLKREDFPVRPEVASPDRRDAGAADSPVPAAPASISPQPAQEGEPEPSTPLAVAAAAVVFWIVAMWRSRLASWSSG